MREDAMDAAALLALVEDGRRPDAVGPLAGRPVVVVHVDDAEATARVAAVTRSLPCVVVGVGPASGAPDLDVLVAVHEDPPAPWVGPGALGALLDGIERNPAAAVVCAQLLRAGRALEVARGLVAESTAYGLLQAGPEHARWLAGQPPRRARAVPDRPPVRVARDGDRVTIVLDRPEVRNAYDASTRDAVVTALELVDADPAATAELRGAGPCFCSGGDLREFGTVADPVAAHAIRTTRSAGALLARVAGRIVAHVHGACVGAGVELPAFASRVVADPATSFRLPEVAMGLVPGAGGTVSVPRRVGWQRAAWLMLSGVTIDAATAHAWGLVDELAPVSPA